MALTKVTGQVINDSTGLVVGVTTVGGGLSATDGFFSGIVTALGNASFSGNLTVGGGLTYEDVKLLKNAPIPQGSSLEFMSGNKIVLEATDTVTVDSDTNNSVDASLTIMEIT